MSQFFWVGNRTAVNFVNTAVEAKGGPVDLLGSSQNLREWLGDAGLLPGERVELLTGWMESTLRYRAQLREGMGRLAAGKRISAELLEQTNTYLRGDQSRVKLTVEGNAYRLQRERPFVTETDVLAPIAASFAEMLANDDLTRLRKCRNPECVLYFYDTSKGGQRAWCSLEQCGNKMRMAALRERRAALGH